MTAASLPLRPFGTRELGQGASSRSCGRGATPAAATRNKKVGPLGWRATQDSKLWPSAPEAPGRDLQPDGTYCKPMESLEQNPPKGRDRMQSDAAVCRIPVPSVSPGLLTVREVARLLKVSTATVYKLILRGDLPHLRVSNAIRVAQEDLYALISGGNRRS